MRAFVVIYQVVYFLSGGAPGAAAREGQTMRYDKRRYQRSGLWANEYRVERLVDSANDGRYLSVGEYPARVATEAEADELVVALNAEADGMTDEREAEVVEAVTGRKGAAYKHGCQDCGRNVGGEWHLSTPTGSLCFPCEASRNRRARTERLLAGDAKTKALVAEVAASRTECDGCGRNVAEADTKRLGDESLCPECFIPAAKAYLAAVRRDDHAEV